MSWAQKLLTRVLGTSSQADPVVFREVSTVPIAEPVTKRRRPRLSHVGAASARVRRPML